MEAQYQHGAWIGKMQEFFERSTRCLMEADSAFSPAPGMYTAAAQMAHVAMTIDWFADAAFLGNPFDMDFQKYEDQARAVTSVSKARTMVKASFDRLAKLASAVMPQEMTSPVIPADSPILPGASRVVILSAIEEHTAHHRGALTVYSRLLGRTPAMPYMEM
jgi:uncharacterized damage-inducible protein DinB